MHFTPDNSRYRVISMAMGMCIEKLCGYAFRTRCAAYLYVGTAIRSRARVSTNILFILSFLLFVFWEMSGWSVSVFH